MVLVEMFNSSHQFRSATIIPVLHAGYGYSHALYLVARRVSSPNTVCPPAIINVSTVASAAIATIVPALKLSSRFLGKIDGSSE